MRMFILFTVNNSYTLFKPINKINIDSYNIHLLKTISRYKIIILVVSLSISLPLLTKEFICPYGRNTVDSGIAKLVTMIKV